MKQSGFTRDPGSGPTSLALSPSFNGYSSGTMAELAARVVGEFELDNGGSYYHNGDDNDDISDRMHRNDVLVDETKPQDLEEDSDFEFAVPGRGDNSSPVSADEIFSNGQIRPLLPLFNTSLVFADTDWRDAYHFDDDNRSIPRFPAPEEENSNHSESSQTSPIRNPLKKLMISERVTSLAESASCSSSEADDLDGVAPETYCVWTPPKQEMRKKSKSTGSSKRWKIRDLLYRSHSDGGDTIVFFTSKQQHHHNHKKAPAKEEAAATEKAQQEQDMKSKVTTESDRKRSYTPHRQDSVGFFANLNGLSRTIQPF